MTSYSCALEITGCESIETTVRTRTFGGGGGGGEDAYPNELCVCVCVCVFFPFILEIKFVGRTSRGHTGFPIHLLSAVRAFIFLLRRIQPFLSLVDREVEFCVLTI